MIEIDFNAKLIDSRLLEDIDKSRQNIKEGGLDECVKSLYSAIDKWSNSQTVSFDSDNAAHAGKVLPQFIDAKDYAGKNYHGDFNLLLLQEVAALVEPSQCIAGHNYVDFRNTPVTLHSLDYMPPGNNVGIRDDLDKVLKFIKRHSLHPLEKATFLYFHIARIQPFDAGNKRTASIIMNTVLSYDGYPVISMEERENTVFLSLFKSAINEYRAAMSKGNQDITQANIGFQQRGFFQYMGGKLQTTLKSVEDQLANLDKYLVTFKAKEPGIQFDAKHRVVNYLKQRKNSCYDVSLNRRDHTMIVTGDISFQQLSKVLSQVYSISYSISDLRDKTNPKIISNR